MIQSVVTGRASLFRCLIACSRLRGSAEESSPKLCSLSHWLYQRAKWIWLSQLTQWQIFCLSASVLLLWSKIVLECNFNMKRMCNYQCLMLRWAQDAHVGSDPHNSAKPPETSKASVNVQKRHSFFAGYASRNFLYNWDDGKFWAWKPLFSFSNVMSF